jgi:glutamyl-tRNA synthetase
MLPTVYRGRFAPSPTGALHLGTVRAACVAWRRARQAQGLFVLRIEDIDGPRVVAGAQEALLRDLQWLRLSWDEGPDTGGPHGPYVQSQRLDHYQRALDQLKAQGLAYPCTCSRRELAAVASAPHDEDGPPYTGACRQGPTHPERPAAWRFKMADPADDFVLQRADGVFAYQLACAVDDGAMGITEVVRGEDLRSSAPRQAALLRALGLPVPDYWHVPLLLGLDGQRLAKRNGAKAVAQLREEGLSAEQVLASAMDGI